MKEKEKKPFYRTWWFWLILVLVLFFCLPARRPKETDTKESTPAAEATEAKTEEVVEVDPLEEIVKDLKNVETKTAGNTVDITYELNSTPYDYTDYVSKALTDYVETSSKIFSDTDYTSIRMDMKDDSGIITSLIMSKDSFKSISWSDDAYTEGIYDRIIDKFDKFYVESTLMKNVDTSKVMYKGK